MTTFIKIFYVNFNQLFAGKFATLIDLMVMHTGIFSIVDNMHDLMCRGNKDSKEALANVQDYNMTKTLTRQCSIPDKTGEVKLFTNNFTNLNNIQCDIELYNYVHLLMENY